MPKSQIIKVKLESNRVEGNNVRKPITTHKKSYPAGQKESPKGN